MGTRVRQPTTKPARTVQRPCPSCGQLTATLNGAYLRWCRESAGLDQRALAALVGLSGPYLSDIERNRRDAPPGLVDIYLRLARGQRPRRRR